MSQDRTRQIQEIVNKRQTRADKIKKAYLKWENLKSALGSLESYRGELKYQSEISNSLKEMGFSEFIKSIENELEELKNLELRLSRSKIHIGVIGRMRQGKSRLIQSLTGLDSETVPSGDQGACTSASSKIFHKANLREVQGEVEFHSWQSFQEEVIAIYYKKLNLGSKPITQEDFANKLPPLPSDKQDANSQRAYERLRGEYHKFFQDYREKLDGSTQPLKKNDIRKYVTQDERDEKGNRLTWDDLPVKEVRIFCNFQDTDIGEIVLVDLPGLGDDNIFDVNRLIEALKQDVDFVLLVRLPDPVTGSSWEQPDRELFEIVRNSLGSFLSKKCSFMVLNRVRIKGENEERGLDSLSHCTRFHNTIWEQHINVHQCVIANCTDSADVRTNILIPTLDYLAENIERLYDEYLQSFEDRLVELHNKISSDLKRASNVLDLYGNEDDLDFYPWFDNVLWPELTNGLQNYLKRLRGVRSNQDTTLPIK